MTTTRNIARYLDPAILQPGTTRPEAVAAIETCLRHRTKTVCVRPCDVALAAERVRGSATIVASVVAFPHGAACPASKTAEASLLIERGAAELDMVVNYGWILSGEWDLLRDDIRAVTAAARPLGVLVKAILETSELPLEAVARATEVAVEAGADFVKTSTGFASGGATEAAVRCMLDTAAGRIQVKASGGIRDAARARRFLDLGCTRLGLNYTSLAAVCGGVPPVRADGPGY
jgi:deoxyribose-phosphate aldolase